MTDNIKKAKEILVERSLTCVLIDGNNVYSSEKRGVKPLLELLETKKDFSNCSAADKVVGAGAAHLYVLLKLKSLWAMVISDSALQILLQNNINVSFEKQVPYIINRAGDGMCPIESCVKDVTDSAVAFSMIKKKLRQLANN